MDVFLGWNEDSTPNGNNYYSIKTDLCSDCDYVRGNTIFGPRSQERSNFLAYEAQLIQ